MKESSAPVNALCANIGLNNLATKAAVDNGHALIGGLLFGDLSAGEGLYGTPPSKPAKHDAYHPKNKAGKALSQYVGDRVPRDECGQRQSQNNARHHHCKAGEGHPKPTGTTAPSMTCKAGSEQTEGDGGQGHGPVVPSFSQRHTPGDCPDHGAQ
jgi:hypothetical protein